MPKLIRETMNDENDAENESNSRPVRSERLSKSIEYSSQPNYTVETVKEDEEEEETEEEEWDEDEDISDAARDLFLTKIITTHKRAMKSSELERARLRDLLFSSEDRCEELLEMNEKLEKRIERERVSHLNEIREIRATNETRTKAESDVAKDRSACARLEANVEILSRQLESLRVRERARELEIERLRDENVKALGVGQHVRELFDERGYEQEREIQANVIAESFALEVRKLKEKVKMYENARAREKEFSKKDVVQGETTQTTTTSLFSDDDDENKDDDYELPRAVAPPTLREKSLPSKDESPFGAMDSEGRVKLAISRLGIATLLPPRRIFLADDSL